MPRVKKTPIDKKGEIINFYEHVPKKYLDEVENPNYNLHNFDIPFRMCIVAPSGSGKTNFLLNLIKVFSQGTGTFADITIVTRNKDEPLYNYLEDKLGNKGLEILEGISNAPDLDGFDKEEQTLIVMDDLVLEKNQKQLEQYFIRARKLNCSLIYISQSYYAVPQLIRQNLTYLVIKKLNTLNDLFRIMREYSLGVDKKELKDS